MDMDISIADGGLPKLKELAHELLAAEAPEPVLLDQVASLATALAAHRRDEVRRHMLDRLAERVKVILPEATDEVRPRLAESSSDALTNLEALIEKAESARSAFERTDASIMEAHGRGDYAAMASLALEADTQKTTLATAFAEVASRVGLAAATPPEAVAAAASAEVVPESVPAGEWIEPAVMAEPGLDDIAAAEEFPISPSLIELSQPPVPAMAGEKEAPAKLDSLEPQSERRRLRGLIRQMRATMDEA